MRHSLVMVCVAIGVIAIGVIFFVLTRDTVFNASPAVVTTAPRVGAPVPFTQLAKGTQSTVPERANYLITSAEELAILWKMIDAKGNPPQVDFTKNIVAAVFAGEQPTAIYTIAVSKVEDADKRTVVVTLARPEDLCATKKAVVTPYDVVVIPATTLSITHEDVATTTPCAG